MFDAQPTPSAEELDRTPVALLAPPRHPNYNTPEGVLFRKAMERIEDEENWFCGLPDGGLTTADEVKFLNGARCLLMAFSPFDNITFSNSESVMEKVRDFYLKRDNLFISLPRYNATHTHAEVMAMLRECGEQNGWL